MCGYTALNFFEGKNRRRLVQMTCLSLAVVGLPLCGGPNDVIGSELKLDAGPFQERPAALIRIWFRVYLSPTNSLPRRNTIIEGRGGSARGWLLSLRRNDFARLSNLQLNLYEIHASLIDGSLFDFILPLTETDYTHSKNGFQSSGLPNPTANRPIRSTRYEWPGFCATSSNWYQRR
jgi:hypothetical protein